MLTEGQIYFANLKEFEDPQDIYFIIDDEQTCRYPSPKSQHIPLKG